ncbi:DUF6885 family protein [Amycolatopsis thermophila]|uniref:Uncharacterized protein n=1 Tax=Amycolatopsis thermophila TaxID=206084 RepID=A0ABU0EY25_9PSEU|nr:hypothetical protein [Amycolatopsis thermophila]MDQ0380202.1 hypothetical protein [Amycolatopsis thermophila]
MSLLDEVRWFPGAVRLVALARAEMPQQKSESAAFVTLVSLRAHGFELAGQDDTACAGAAPATAAEAIGTLSGGRLTAVVAQGEWTASALKAILAGVPELPDVTLVAFVDTEDFGAPDTPERALRDYLEGGLPPFWGSRWRARHCVFLGGTIEGAGTLVAIVDGYRSFGRDGVHLQLLDRVAAALRGLLLVVPAADAPAARALVARAGFTP